MCLDSTPLIRFPSLAKRVANASPLAKGIVLLRNPIERAYSHFTMMKLHAPHAETRSFDQAIKDELELAQYTEQDSSPLSSQQQYNKLSLLRKFHLSQMMGSESASTFRAFFPSKHDSGCDSASVLWFYDQRYLDHGLYDKHLSQFEDAFGRDRMLVLSFHVLIKEPKATLDRVAAFLGLLAPVDSDTVENEADYQPVNQSNYDVNATMGFVKDGERRGEKDKEENEGEDEEEWREERKDERNEKERRGKERMGKERKRKERGGRREIPLSAHTMTRVRQYYAATVCAIQQRYGIDLEMN